VIDREDVIRQHFIGGREAPELRKAIENAGATPGHKQLAVPGGAGIQPAELLPRVVNPAPAIALQ
jgi:hypothetical protein